MKKIMLILFIVVIPVLACGDDSKTGNETHPVECNCNDNDRVELEEAK